MSKAHKILSCFEIFRTFETSVVFTGGNYTQLPLATTFFFFELFIYTFFWTKSVNINIVNIQLIFFINACILINLIYFLFEC